MTFRAFAMGIAVAVLSLLAFPGTFVAASAPATDAPTSAPTYYCDDTKVIPVVGVSLAFASLGWALTLWNLLLFFKCMRPVIKLKTRIVVIIVSVLLALAFLVAGGAVYTTSCQGVIRSLINEGPGTLANDMLIADVVMTPVLTAVWLGYVLWFSCRCQCFGG